MNKSVDHLTERQRSVFFCCFSWHITSWLSADAGYRIKLISLLQTFLGVSRKIIRLFIRVMMNACFSSFHVDLLLIRVWWKARTNGLFCPVHGGQGLCLWVARISLTVHNLWRQIVLLKVMVVSTFWFRAPVCGVGTHGSLVRRCRHDVVRGSCFLAR